MNRKSLTKEQVYFAINNGEFPIDVAGSNKKVAVLMTQDWCSEWKAMKKWMDTEKEEPSLDIYELIYNTAEYFQDFLGLKEQKWKNDLIPYIRYYEDGRFVRQSNFVSKEEFFEILKKHNK